MRVVPTSQPAQQPAAATAAAAPALQSTQSIPVIEDDFDPDEGIVDTPATGPIPVLPQTGVPGNMKLSTDPNLRVIGAADDARAAIDAAQAQAAAQAAPAPAATAAPAPAAAQTAAPAADTTSSDDGYYLLFDTDEDEDPAERL
jgi:hypothetical protein